MRRSAPNEMPTGVIAIIGAISVRTNGLPMTNRLRNYGIILTPVGCFVTRYYTN